MKKDELEVVQFFDSVAVFNKKSRELIFVVGPQKDNVNLETIYGTGIFMVDSVEAYLRERSEVVHKWDVEATKWINENVKDLFCKK